MFKVIVFACMLQAPEQCLKFEDTWGLKATRVQCEERIGEMVNSIKSLLPQYGIIGAKCERKGDMT